MEKVVLSKKTGQVSRKSSAEESQKCAARTKKLLKVLKKKETALVIHNYQNIFLKK